MFRRILVGGLAIAALAGVARADIVSLSAMSFVHQDPTANVQDPTPDNGTLSPVVGVDLFQSVDFPVDGNKICKITLVYGDTNGTEGITAKLMRKRIVIGGVVNAAPAQLAKAASAGTVVGMRRVSANVAAANATIDEVNYFYYVQVTAQNFNTPLVGVQIEHKPACP